MKKLAIIILLFTCAINAKAQANHKTADSIKLVNAKKELTIFFKAVDTAGMAQLITEGNPLTILAPDDKEFAKWNGFAAMNDTLFKPAAKTKLVYFLQEHIIPGKLSSKDIAAAIHKNNGEAKFTTLAGTSITFKINADRNLVLVDDKGTEHIVKQFDMQLGDDGLFVIDSVLN